MLIVFIVIVTLMNLVQSIFPSEPFFKKTLPEFLWRSLTQFDDWYSGTSEESGAQTSLQKCLF
jgi:hypothetical protein